MQLHVLAGCLELLRPQYLSPEAAAGLIGPHIRVPRAFWLSPRCGDRYHEFLQGQPGDRRTEVMAAALKDDFGTRFEPLLVLPQLLDELETDQRRDANAETMNQRSQLAVLTEILECGHVRRLHLHALALPLIADPDGFWAIPAGLVPDSVRRKIEGLRTALVNNATSCEIDTHVLEVTSGLPVFDTVYNNSLCAQFLRRLEPRFLECGWRSDPALLSSTVSTILSGWNTKGLSFIMPLRPAHLDATADLIFGQLLRK